MPTQLRETVAVGTPTLDREAGVVRGVKILGAEAPTKRRRYTEQAMRAAASMYENRSVYADHSESAKPRQVADLIGRLANVQFREGSLYGDLHYNTKGQHAAAVEWIAANPMVGAGLSHDAVGTTVMRSGLQIVESIDRVNSVDLVTAPATTKSLFESQGEPMEPMDLTALTIEQLKAGRADLIESIQQPLKAEITTLTEAKAAAEAKFATAERAAKIAKMLTEARLPEKAVTATFLTQLQEAKDEASAKALIEDRKALCETPAARPAGATPVSKEQRLAEGQAPTIADAKAFAAAIR